MALYLTVHTRYKDVQIGIFNNTILVDHVFEENKKISRNFVILINDLLNKNNLKLENLDFMAAHQGPAPFTTLRVALSSVNGLAFATKIPLIGINGLEAMISDFQNNKNITVIMLNAFCQDIYYAIHNPENNESYFGFAPALEFLKELESKYQNTFTFVGNGTEIYFNDIQKIFGARSIIPDPLPEMASLESIANQAYKKWLNSNQKEKQIMPIYLKSSTPKIQISRQL